MKRVCNCAKRWKSEPDEQKIHKAIIYHRPVCYLHDDNFNRSISEHLFPPPKDIRFSIIEDERKNPHLINWNLRFSVFYSIKKNDPNL